MLYWYLLGAAATLCAAWIVENIHADHVERIIEEPAELGETRKRWLRTSSPSVMVVVVLLGVFLVFVAGVLVELMAALGLEDFATEAGAVAVVAGLASGAMVTVLINTYSEIRRFGLDRLAARQEDNRHGEIAPRLTQIEADVAEIREALLGLATSRDGAGSTGTLARLRAMLLLRSRR